MIKIGLDGSKNGGLWVLKSFSGFGSGSLVSSNVLIRDGVGSNIRKSRDVLVVRWVVVSHG